MSLDESVWNYIMVYECILKRIDAQEAIWRYMKVYDRICM